MPDESQPRRKLGLPSVPGVRFERGRIWPARRTLVLLIALFALSVPLAFQGGAAKAAFPGQSGRLAVSYAGEVWVANADGSSATQLTATPGVDYSPSWSPDGTKIAFTSQRYGFEIFVMNADGSDERRVTFNAAPDSQTAWTADSKQIVYQKRSGSVFEVYVVNADGSGGERRLVEGAAPDTSPYGDKVAFTGTGRPCPGLCTIKLDGSDLRQVTDFGDSDADWSPGGTELVFTRRSPEEWDIYRIHVNGIGLVQLTKTPDRSEVAPVWSPDGTKIAFLGCPAPLGSVPDCPIYVINRDGSGERQVPNLTASSASTLGALDWQPLPPFPQGKAPVALTVSIIARGGTGTVRSAPEGLECPLACSTEFDRGSTIRLEAQPTTRDASFLGWSGACSGRSAPCSVVMDGEKGVAASFGPSRLRLIVSVRGPGRVLSSPAGIACPRRCAASFARDLRVTLRALPARGAKLVAWSGACRGSKGCRVSMSADRAVRARFRR